MTQGSVDRQEFAEYYGAYMEMVYLLSNGDLTKLDEIMNWDTEKFLTLGEYMLRKKIVEKIK
jgi:hypothetical protein